MPTEKQRKPELLSPDLVRQELERILISDDFRASESISTFLRFVVEETLAGREDQIKGYTIAVRAFGRPPDFDPQLDTIIRTQARRLRRALDIFYLTEGRNYPIRITMPKGSYVPIFQYEDRGPSSKHAASQDSAPDPGAEVQPAIELSFSNYHDLSAPEMSLAVLPFVNLSQDEADAYFAAGLTEEFIVAFTRFPDFTVIGPLNKLTGQQVGLRQIGREYGVRFVLQGTVRKRGQTIRISVKLGETGQGRSIWAETYDYNLKEISLQAIEDEVSNQVAATIADDFGVIPRRLFEEVQGKPVESSSATEAILRYNYFNVTGTPQSLSEAIEALELAHQLAPNDVQIMATLADSYYMDDALSANIVADSFDQAETLARRAVALDPKSQMAHMVMASIHTRRCRTALAIDQCHEAVALNPNNAHMISNCAYLLVMLGEGDTGIALLNKAKRLNPHYPSWFHHVTFLYFYRQGLYEEALREANRANLPSLMIDPIARAAALGQMGRHSEAQAALEELYGLVPDFASRIDEMKPRLFATEENAEMLLDGLRKAGLETST